MFTDSHCHLNFPELQSRLDEIREDMHHAQVTRALLISTRLDTFGDVHRLAMSHDNFWCTAGVHPDEENVQEPSLDDLLRLGRLEKVVGIGETGLDYHRLGERSPADMDWQRDRFCVHIRAARQLDLPLVIHTRNASEDTLSLLRDEGQGGSLPLAKGVFHCFTETAEVATQALDMGFYISFSGIVTFKNASDLRDIAAWVPLDRLLIETDSPYLAPAPHRGKTNDPSLVRWVGKKIAEIKGLSEEEVASQTTLNFLHLFSKTQSN